MDSSNLFGRQRSIRAAAANGHNEVVALLLADRRVNAAAFDNFPLRAAAANGHVDTVRCLLDSDPTGQYVDAAVRGSQALLRAAENGHDRVFDLLMLQPGTKPSAAFVAFCARGSTSRVAKWLHRFSRPETLRQALEAAARHGHAAVVQQLLASKAFVVDDTGQLASTLSAAARNGHVAVLQRLLADPRSDLPANASASGYAAVLAAAARGYCGSNHDEVVELLLADPRVSGPAAPLPTDCLSSAAERGDVRLVGKLLPHPSFADRLRLCAGGALRRACLFGQLAVVELLLTAPGLDLTQQEASRALRHAALAGHADVVDRLLLDPRAHPQDAERTLSFYSLPRTSLSSAARSGHLDVVERLLADPRVDATGYNCDAVREAAARLHKKVVRRLLQDPRVIAVGGAEIARGAAAIAKKSARDTSQSGAASLSPTRRAAAPGPEIDRQQRAAATRARRPPWTGPSDVQAGLCAAIDDNDVNLLRRILSDPRANTQAEKDPCSSPLSVAAAAGRSRIVELLLADPCCSRASCDDALRAACAAAAGHSTVVGLLLADPRTSFSRCLRAEPDQLLDSVSESESPFFITARDSDRQTGSHTRRCLYELLADPRVCAVYSEAGQDIVHGLRKARAMMSYDAGLPGNPSPDPVPKLLTMPSVLHACLAASPTFPSFMRNAVSVAAIGNRAWARRRLVLMARQRMLDSDD